jgi:hypothetical protein
LIRRRIISLQASRPWIVLLLAFVASGGVGLAQEKPDSPEPKQNVPSITQITEAPPQAASTGSQHLSETPPIPDKPLDENPKRILDIIPNFQTTNEKPEYMPMTPREKYILAYHQTVDFSAHIGNLFQAALQQASNGQPHYGQGWGPYAQRFGAAEADQVTSAFFIFGFLPHVLKQDPRYFRRGQGSPWSRIFYAASRTVIARTDTGNSTFNTPQVLGQLLQQGISTAYYPPQDRSVNGVFQNWGINLAYNTAYNALKEYYPDFLRWVFHRHRQEQAAVSTPAAPAVTSTRSDPPSKP